MRVELDMFSGRPNPVWELPQGLGRELLELESKLQPAGRLGNEPPPLGYRGFIYGEPPESRRVFDGFVTKDGRLLEDEGRGIERLLIASMPDPIKELRGFLPDELQA